VSEPQVPASGSRPLSSYGGVGARPQPSSLADVLERVLDKGIIIAGDIKVNLLDIELLTIKIRLLIVSVDKAKEMGIDWWRNDPMLSSDAQGVADENRRLRERIEELEAGGADSDTAAGDGARSTRSTERG
jgi:Gas vesicle protein